MYIPTVPINNSQHNVYEQGFNVKLSLPRWSLERLLKRLLERLLKRLLERLLKRSLERLLLRIVYCEQVNIKSSNEVRLRCGLLL
jgi:hypothetical protein